VPAYMSIDERPHAWVLTVAGEFDYAVCPAFRSHVDRVLRAMPDACVVDLSRVDYLDSSGLGLLLSLYREYTDAGGRLVLVPSEMVYGILDITKLGSLFETAPDVDTTVAGLSPSPSL